LRSGYCPVDVCKLTRELIDIPSVTGEESEVGKYLAQLLERLDYKVEMQEVTSGRANVIATTGAPARVVLSTHMDTVPPYIASSEDDEFIHGRGACDAKGIIAAQIAAAEKLRADGVEEIALLFTVDEEATSAGAKEANNHRLASSCRYLINGEPTDNRLAIGSKGSLQVTITTAGRAAHSAYPEQGDSAVEKLLDVLSDIRQIDWPGDDFFGETTCNIGVISGGVRSNVVPAEARASLQIRLTTKAAKIRELIESVVDGRASLEFHSAHDPQRMLAVDGFEQTVVRFTTDIPYLTNWGKALLIGPGSILDAHTAHERVAKRELLQAVEVYRDLAKRLQNRER
ncbi:MAG TPA: M20/M25/M40 family metallo-hydrolase, partial [Pyrinomonadaceae bacterium]|nr:M20/M25/M40 family metallo-hydrolase [Pyrinomonadaceae bacterium]